MGVTVLFVRPYSFDRSNKRTFLICFFLSDRYPLSCGVAHEDRTCSCLAVLCPLWRQDLLYFKLFLSSSTLHENTLCLLLTISVLMEPSCGHEVLFFGGLCSHEPFLRSRGACFWRSLSLSTLYEHKTALSWAFFVPMTPTIKTHLLRSEPPSIHDSNVALNKRRGCTFLWLFHVINCSP